MLGSLLKRASRVAPARVGRVAPRIASSFRSAVSQRTFSTEAPKAVVASQEDAVVAEEPKGGILNRGYEWYPVVGLGLAAAVTQEWLIVDEYWVTSFAYGTVMYAAYVLGHDKILASGKEAFAKQTAQTKAAFGIRLDNLKRYKALEEFSLSHAEELRNLYAEEAKVNAMAVEYQNLKHKFDTRNAILSKLKAIKMLEEDARRQAILALATKAGEYVATSYAAAPQDVKDKNIESGIAAIAPELTTRSIALARAAPFKPLAQDDPVKLLFDEFLSKPRTFQQLGVENYVAKFMARRAADAASKKH